MTRTWAIRLMLLVGLTITSAVAIVASATGSPHSSARAAAALSGFNETPPILTNGSGTFHATISGDSLTYTLSFSGLTSSATQAHLHFGQPGVAGGVFLFLCTNLGNGPAGTPACPANGGSVTRTVTAADIVGLAAQNVTAGDFAGALRIIRSGDAYANVHSVNFPMGEIRGQVRVGGDRWFSGTQSTRR
ncbi:MAG: CHRD domain-containing protein [Solirubrobacterales bacterium]|nr:CHRD domain-containing protein [Solirubrobacterales bacterium]MBV9944251.1 CHRD domain-containing protein [Solirubrobacterales bacterium]